MIVVATAAVLFCVGSFVFATFPRVRGAQGRPRMLPLLAFAIGVGIFLFAKPFVWLSDSIFVYEHLRAPSHFAFPSLPLLLGVCAALVTPVWIEWIGARRIALFVAVVASLAVMYTRLEASKGSP